jgi:hypothetical protein
MCQGSNPKRPRPHASKCFTICHPSVILPSTLYNLKSWQLHKTSHNNDKPQEGNKTQPKIVPRLLLLFFFSFFISFFLSFFLSVIRWFHFVTWCFRTFSHNTNAVSMPLLTSFRYIFFYSRFSNILICVCSAAKLYMFVFRILYCLWQLSYEVICARVTYLRLIICDIDELRGRDGWQKNVFRNNFSVSKYVNKNWIVET